jgi:hypothetical protein
MANTTAGMPRSFSEEVGREKKKISFGMRAKEITLRNVGCNTLWVSLDGKVWHDVACGTSWDQRLEADYFYIRTKVGTTKVVIIVTS